MEMAEMADHRGVVFIGSFCTLKSRRRQSRKSVNFFGERISLLSERGVSDLVQEKSENIFHGQNPPVAVGNG
jgi:hypothetical protein